MTGTPLTSERLRELLIAAANGNAITADEAWALIHEWDARAALLGRVDALEGALASGAIPRDTDEKPSDALPTAGFQDWREQAYWWQQNAVYWHSQACDVCPDVPIHGFGRAGSPRGEESA